MVGVCFFFESYDVDVWSGRHIDLDAWTYAALAAGDVDQMVVVNCTEQVLHPGGVFSVVDVMPTLQGRVARLVGPGEAESAVSLWGFDHQVDWYVFGPARGWSEIPGGDVVDVTVPQAGSAPLHSTHVASTVLLHRHHVVGG